MYKINVCCVKAGDKYDSDYVNTLYLMTKRYLTIPFDFICLTENSQNLLKQIKVISLDDRSIKGWWNKCLLFKPGLLSSSCLYLDLDMIILKNIDDIFKGKAIFKEQDHSKATYAKKIDKSEGKISWNNDTAKKIIGKINGLYPFPGAFFIYKGERIKILKAELSSTEGNPGLILNDNFEIGCSKNSIKILEIQRQGKKVQKIAEFMLGTQMKKGTNLKDA